MTSSKRIKMSNELRAWLENEAVFPEFFTIKTSKDSSQDYEIMERTEDGAVEAVSSRMGQKGFVLKVKVPNRKIIRAAKFAVSEDYKGGRDALEEREIADILRNGDGLFSVPEMTGEVEAFPGMPNSQESFVCFISDWVEGETLEDYVSNKPEAINPLFICSVANQLSYAIHYLKTNDLKHDDLHVGNIMLKQKNPGLVIKKDRDDELQVVVIDTGSLKPLTQETQKDYDDMLRFKETLVILYNALILNRRLLVETPVFAEKLKQLIEELLIDDPQRALPDLYRDLVDRIEVLKRSIEMPISSESRLAHPCDAISAEHLVNDEMLLKLFVTKLPWYNELVSSNPVVLTGPRGCGKSMLFRYLSAKTHLHSQMLPLERLQSFPFFGVYINCASELQNSLSWVGEDKEKAQKFSSVIITFYNLIVTRELLRDIATVQKHPEAMRFYQIMDSTEDAILNLLNNYLPAGWLKMRLSGTPLMWQAAESIDQLRMKVHAAMLRGENLEQIKLPESFLGELTGAMAETSGYFKKNRVAFFLDDYTSNRIPLVVQHVLNKMIWDRRGSHVVKISCEKSGFDAGSMSGVRIDAEREYITVDTGSYFLDADDSRIMSQDFIKDFLNLRLEAAEWTGRVDKLIGDSDTTTYIGLARLIYNTGSGAGKTPPYYYGIDVLADIWSGDIATILQVVRTMFSYGKVSSSSLSQVSKSHQDRAFRTVSRSYVETICEYHPFGHEMELVVDDFGKLVKRILMEAKPFSGEPLDAPKMMPRIEMSESFGESYLAEIYGKNKKAARIAKELLRRAIFIELPPSGAKEKGSKGTVRWQLRRIYLPAFRAALGKNHYINVKNTDEFIDLLINSKDFTKKILQRYIDVKQSKKQTEMFKERGDE